MTLEPGKKLLHFELIEKLGEGGMGAVWRASDTTLGRDVAIKVLPQLFSEDPERLARFEREAKLLASLNHPNIAAVYGLHEDSGVRFLAMEYVEGEDLSKRLERGPLSVDTTLDVASQMAAGIEAAHERGVVHRDLKPANVIVAPDGRVRLLDFGLAKAYEANADGSDPSMSPTMTSAGTVAGMILGTAAYMSPEQARGKTLDRRTDLWSFGCVLYECLTGDALFAGETVSDSLAAILRKEPNFDALPADTPPMVRLLIQRCLTRDPNKRLRDAGDARLELEQAIENPDPAALGLSSPGMAAVAGEAPPAKRSWLPWVLAALPLLLLIVMQLSGDDPALSGATAGPIRFHVPLENDRSVLLGDQPVLAISRDGRKIVFAAEDPEQGTRVLYSRNLEQDTVIAIPRTQDARSPFYSPDGKSLAFFASGKLQRVTPGQGEPIPIADAPNARGGVWLEDDTIIYSPDFAKGLWRVSSNGGNAEEILTLDEAAGERTYRWPTVAPDGKTIIFTVGDEKSPNDYDGAHIDAFTLPDGPRKRLIEGANAARMAGPNRLAYYVNGSIYVMGYDPKANETVGEPVVAIMGVGGDSSSGAAFFDISENGDLVHVAFDDDAGKSKLVFVERDGSKQALDLPADGYFHPEFSPDGTKILVQIGGRRSTIDGDIWIYDITDKGLRRITFSGADYYPIWRDDGEKIIFLSGADGSAKISDADGNNPRIIVPDTNDVFGFPGSWSAAKGLIAFVIVGSDTNIHRMEETADSPDQNKIWIEEAAGPNFSPDGKYLTYFSPPAGGGSSAYVVEVDGTRKWQISGDVGVYPRWSPDGKKIFYLANNMPGRPLFEVDVDTTDGFKFSMPRMVLDDTTAFTTITAPAINWDTDGERFVFVEPLRDAEGLTRIQVALNWADSIEVGNASK